MKRFSSIFLAVSFLTALIALFGAPQPDPPDLEKLKEKPIATDDRKAGALLKQWWKDGTASGNAGDFYDNRDSDHSPLDMKRYPQLSAIKYSPEDVKAMRHWAAARMVLPHVTFGNSSTSAPAHLGGSNPRSYYVTPFGLSLLYNQYTKNNIYFYPEHRDHDPGHNGLGYRYNSKEEYIGWMRTSADGVQLFNTEGLLVVDKDLQLRCLKGRTVYYVQAPPQPKTINTAPLRMVLGDTIVRYEYDGKGDWRGRRAGTEPASDPKK